MHLYVLLLQRFVALGANCAGGLLMPIKQRRQKGYADKKREGKTEAADP